jgi:transposase InsO family protein
VATALSAGAHARRADGRGRRPTNPSVLGARCSTTAYDVSFGNGSIHDRSVQINRNWFLSDNAGAYIAADTRALVRSLGLKPINTPVCRPQGNGMAKGFVNTFKRDYVARMTCVTRGRCSRNCRRPSSTSTKCIRTRR